MYPKILSAAAAAILLSVFCVDSASAAGGCGPGFHRGPAGDVCLIEGRSWSPRLWWYRLSCTRTNGLRPWSPLAPADEALRDSLTCNHSLRA